MPPIQTQSSFIPRKPLTNDKTLAPQGGGTGFFTVVSIIVFLLSGLSAGGAYAYEQYLKTNIASSKATLEKAKGAFEPEIIFDLQALGSRITSAKTLLTNHPAPTKLLSALGDATLQTVQFTKLSYATKDLNGMMKGAIELEGKAQTLSSVALQSDEFGKSRIFKNPIFANIVPLEAGGVQFRVTLEVDLDALEYSKTLSK